MPPQQRFASVVLVDARGWLLMQERDEHPVIDPDTWGLVGGHVEPGETFEDGAHRELAEETGIRMPLGRLRLLGEFNVFHERSNNAAGGSLDLIQVFLASTHLSDADVQCHEGRQIVFVDPERLRRGELTLSAGAAAALPHLLASDEYATMTP